ncbi:MAG: phosphoenolpyruvate kinase [Candidatus Eisenbacteria bacterium]
MKPTLTPAELFAPSQRLAAAYRTAATRYPGDHGGRQAVHTVYGGAHLFRSDTAQRLGALALRSLDEYAPTAQDLAQAIDLPAGLAEDVYARVREKLTREPVEDFRIDFEDGYGHRPDSEEDGHAISAAEEMAQGLRAGTLPPFCGIRIKTLSAELAPRSLRTLDLFVSTLRATAMPGWPAGFVVTLPKILQPDAVAALADVLDALEKKLGLAHGTIPIELMIETPQSIFAADGGAAAPGLVAAGRGRVGSAHFGTYDYTASLDITAAHQHMAHPSCDFAKHMLQVSLAGTAVRLSDGATNILPVAPHRAAEGGPPLGEAERAANRRVVHAAWKLHASHVRHSLTGAYYQGWDLHPAQLPTRYATVYSFFLEGLDAAAERLSNFVGKAAQATLVGEVFDDAATGQGLLNYFLRAINCGAIDEAEAVRRTGLSIEDFEGRSFLKILARRRT